MTYLGHMENGLVVFDERVSLPEGAKVSVEPITEPRMTPCGTLQRRDRLHLRPAGGHGRESRPLHPRDTETMTRVYSSAYTRVLSSLVTGRLHVVGQQLEAGAEVAGLAGP